MAKKKISKKAQMIVRSNMFISAAALSLIVNAFFIVFLITLSVSNSLDASVLNDATNRYCVDHSAENYAEILQNVGNAEEAEAIFNITCLTGDFSTYYQSAIDSYYADLGIER